MNRYALITGASRGIGRAIAVELAKEGCNVIINYKSNNEAAKETLRLVREAGSDGELLPFDVSKPDEINQALDKWFAAHPDEYIDVLINNAGIVADELMLWMEPEQWHSVIDVNLNGFFYCTRRVLEGMVENRHGRIVNISSIGGQKGIPGQTAYAAAKAALIGATRSLSTEASSRGITVNAVAPGLIDTEIINKNDISDDVQRFFDNIPMQRLGKPEEVAYLVSFLCSDRANYISGQVIGINGGAL